MHHQNPSFLDRRWSAFHGYPEPDPTLINSDPIGPELPTSLYSVSYTHLRAHETPEHLVCRLLLEKKDWLAVQDLSDQSLSGLDQVPDTHETLTIDGPKTRDFDDALTVISWNTTSIQLAVHITDLSRVLHPGTPLFHEAEQRISSVYTPEAVYLSLIHI